MTSHPNHLQDSGARKSAGAFVVVGTVEQIRDVLCGPQQHNDHCKGYQYFQYLADSEKRMDAVREEARKIIAARRAIEDAAEVDPRKHERV